MKFDFIHSKTILSSLFADSLKVNEVVNNGVLAADRDSTSMSFKGSFLAVPKEA